MAAFQAIAQATTSADGLIETLIDASPYGNNDQGYQVGDFASRSFLLKDAAGNTLASLPFVGTALTVPYPHVSDLWIVAQLVLNTPDYSDTIKIPCDRITKNLFRNLLKQGCCANRIIDERLSYADLYLYGCEIEATAGNGPGFNTDINASYKFLTAPKF